jgi:hypothetical protein
LYVHAVCEYIMYVCMYIFNLLVPELFF